MVLVEGLYTLVAEDGSSTGPDLFDAQIFIDTPKSARHGPQHARGVQMCLARAAARPAADLGGTASTACGMRFVSCAQ